MMARRGSVGFRAAITAAVVAVGLADVAAQPIRERRTFTRVMELRHRLAEACRDGDEALRRRVAEALGAPPFRDPLELLGRGLAAARGVEADSLFLFRHGLVCFATPEVPDGKRFPNIHLTMHAPFRAAVPGPVEFRLRILDAGGVQRWAGTISEGTTIEDLLRYSCVVDAPLAALVDGEYRVEVDTLVGGEAPRATDPQCGAVFSVVRGFPDRMKALEARASAIADSVAPGDLVAVKGVLAEIRRVFVGEPRQGLASAVRNIEQLERMLDNLEAERPVLAGLRGWVTLAIETGPDEAGTVCVRLREHRDAQPPLVLILPGAPAWRPAWGRMSSPQTTAPGWLRDALQAARFDRDGHYQLAVLESPGRYKNAAVAVRRAARALRDLLGTGARLALIGEREGALAVSGAINADPDLAEAAVLVTGGALYGDPETLRDLKLLAVSGHGHPGNENLARVASRLEKAGAVVRRVEAAASPWAIALETALPEVQAFLAAVWE